MPSSALKRGPTRLRVSVHTARVFKPPATLALLSEFPTEKCAGRGSARDDTVPLALTCGGGPTDNQRAPTLHFPPHTGDPPRRVTPAPCERLY
ncbi:hypothetical protein E2C01_005987 [Portunus trituberculatus]|uniref:Uncharacterized protein n=1 Tax=Portunus trituberculatus TaxID=210409 RepID=A0A5B7CWN3_PORTR|nr:hypothetical protein [Portunus trituberculatus]